MKYLNRIYTVTFLVIVLTLFSCKNVGKNFKSFADDDTIATIVSDNENELMDAIAILNKKGGTIYIDTPVISLKKNNVVRINWDFPGGIIGIKQENGEYPRLDFTYKYLQKDFSGIEINDNNKFLKYIIIEHTPYDGISIYGQNNTLDHVISRYNYGIGFAVYGDNNNFKYCYAYRNCDFHLAKVSSKADGFKINGEHNILTYCFSWDNSNNGFNFERTFLTEELSYLHSGSWNNGNLNVFTGKYDYDNGYPLDKKLWTIKQFIESDPNFATNYYNKKYSIDNAHIEGHPAKNWTSKIQSKIRLEGNGFTLGSENKTQGSEVKRNIQYCIAFGNKEGGFIDNYINHKSYSVYMTNCVSFNNYINYRLPYTFSKWSDNWSWDSKNDDKFDNNKITTKMPTNTNSVQKLIYSVRDQIIKSVFADTFPENINFDSSISSLK